MSLAFLGLLIGTSTDLPPLFESGHDGLEWMLEHTSTLEAALPILDQRHFHLIMVEDARPPGGLAELLNTIRQMQPGAKVIVIDATPSPADVIEAMRSRAFSYFSRPFQSSAVLEMMRAAVLTPGWDDGITLLSAKPEFLTLSMRCDLHTADRLQQFMEEMCTGLDPTERSGVAIAFREMLLNAIEHGGKLNPNQWVRVSRVRTNRSLVYHMEDPGAGFAASALADSAVAHQDDSPLAHLEARANKGVRMGGFGILMAQKLVDQVLYNERGNEVLLVKHLD